MVSKSYTEEFHDLFYKITWDFKDEQEQSLNVTIKFEHEHVSRNPVTIINTTNTMVVNSKPIVTETKYYVPCTVLDDTVECVRKVLKHEEFIEALIKFNQDYGFDITPFDLKDVICTTTERLCRYRDNLLYKEEEAEKLAKAYAARHDELKAGFEAI